MQQAKKVNQEHSQENGRHTRSQITGIKQMIQWTRDDTCLIPTGKKEELHTVSNQRSIDLQEKMLPLGFKLWKTRAEEKQGMR